MLSVNADEQRLEAEAILGLTQQLGNQRVIGSSAGKTRPRYFEGSVKTRSLQIHRPDGSTQVIAIEKATVTIGRAEDNDIILLDSQRSVSRWHAHIANEADSDATISDLNSANGTTVNGRSVRDPVPLRPNDKIGIGHFWILFREETTDVPFTIQTAAVDLRELQQSLNCWPWRARKDSLARAS